MVLALEFRRAGSILIRGLLRQYAAYNFRIELELSIIADQTVGFLLDVVELRVSKAEHLRVIQQRLGADAEMPAYLFGAFELAAVAPTLSCLRVPPRSRRIRALYRARHRRRPGALALNHNGDFLHIPPNRPVCC